MNQPRRFLGISLSGAKNQKTAIASLEYYPRENKIFLLELYEKILARDQQTSDQAVLELIEEVSESITGLGIYAPLSLPPCVTCTRKTCPLPSKCTVPAVKWMREYAKKTWKQGPKDLRDFTPYTQRPIELFLINSVLPELKTHETFEIDETLGGNRAPIALRMSFLQRHLAHVNLVEASPKLTLSILAHEFEWPKRLVQNYRRLEQGIEAREELLDLFIKRFGVFIYEKDHRQLAHSLSSFDSFLCAYTTLLKDVELTEPAPKGFPAQSGWIAFPKISVEND